MAAHARRVKFSEVFAGRAVVGVRRIGFAVEESKINFFALDADLCVPLAPVLMKAAFWDWITSVSLTAVPRCLPAATLSRQTEPWCARISA